MSDPGIVLPIVSLVAIAALSAIGLRRRGIHDVRGPSATSLEPPDASLARFDERIARLEQSVDVIAVEIERVGESQRFLTKVLTERSAPSRATEESRKS